MPNASPSKSNSETLPDPWEAAYLQFETPQEEVEKFKQRLSRLGAAEWPREAEIVELFCGRGSGLLALAQFGFTRLEGVDLSPRLLAEFEGTVKVIVADCRKLPFPDRSRDILIVQGGLHHLPGFPEDLAQTFSEMRRVLRVGGRVMIVEPWLTPFLRFVHFICGRSLARRASKKLDALATMIEHERTTYEQWLSHPQTISKLVREHFSPLYESFAWGKWSFVGSSR